MGLFGKLSKKEEARLDEEVPAYSSVDRPTRDAPPPTYTIDDPLTKGTVEKLTAAFTNLQVASSPPPFPEPEHCLVHLKLLAAFSTLKGDVGNTDELFEIEDRKVEKVEDRQQALDALKEKRWALFVARAVDRFQDWWLKALVPQEGSVRATSTQLTMDPEAALFPKQGRPQNWSTSMLPPLDVLMVWHTFMLNPRDYYQDCVRYGLKDTWATGMPWATVNDAIDIDFNYDIPEAGKIQFTSSTGRNWENTDDSLQKTLECYNCKQQNTVPWTTCMSLPSVDYTQLQGNGYGDRDFRYTCTGCSKVNNHETLRVMKFKNDAEDLILHDWPMGGTVLDRDGQVTPNSSQKANPGNFANRLVQLEIRRNLPLLEMTPTPDISEIKLMIEDAIKDEQLIRKLYEGSSKLLKPSLTLSDKVAIRRMMATYWDNASMFSMELGSAVFRQGLFVDKMQNLDWLHSPAAIDTMKRLLVKYERFIFMMDKYPEQAIVPTLDVDLAWHTHQLSPQAYYDYVMEKTKKFVNHDDKISEDKVSEYFEWTSDTYQKTYKEVYSECTCWYCETLRYRHTAAFVFGAGKHDKPADDFYLSGRASTCPPDNSAHISTHNFVRINESAVRARIFNRARESQRRSLDVSYTKASKKAEKKGRKPPRKEDFYHQHHWGSPRISPYPFLAIPMVVGGIYFAGETDAMNAGNGQHGVCAAGTCGMDPVGSGSDPFGGIGGSPMVAGAYAGGGGGGGDGGGGGF